MTPPGTPEGPEEYFAGHPLGLALHRRLLEVMAPRAVGGAAGGFVEVRVTRSQVAYWRRHPFAFLWLPGRYLRAPCAEVVLSIALGRSVPSPRFKQVVHPAPRQWMHHLEVHDVGDVDDEVAAWLREAWERAG